MNKFRNESLKYCLAFCLIAGIGLAYAGLWSIKPGTSTTAVLTSTLDSSVWVVAGLNLAAFLLGLLFRNKFPLVTSWILSVLEGAAVFVLVNAFRDPLLILGFIIPIFFAVMLLDWKQSAVFSAVAVASCFYLLSLHYPGWTWSTMPLPLACLVGVTLLAELSLSQLHTALDWFFKRYQTALVNEQIIRDDEVKLEKLVNSLKDYDKYLSQTNMSLIEARDEAEQARNVKQSFVQNVSHELRTPLNLIIGFSEAMVNSPQSYGEVNWTPDLRGDIECIYQNSQHLKNLIDDILDMASLESKKYEVVLSDADLNSIIREVVLINENAYHSKGLSLETRLSPRIHNVRGDAIRLKQVMLNLLSNALKYTAHGGVTIVSSVQNGMALVKVSDTGKGIRDEDKDRVFEAFFQVDRSNIREDSGTGLGLFISKELIELHGGEMSLTSEFGKGTTVWFTIPLSRE